MVTIVVCFNLLIAIALIGLAVFIVRLKARLARANQALIVAEQRTHWVLFNAPEAIRHGQLGAYELRDRFAGLSRQLQQVQLALSLISVLGQFAIPRLIHKPSVTRSRSVRWSANSIFRP